MTDEFDNKYVNTNLAKDAPPYDGRLFVQWNSRLELALHSYTPGISYGIIIAMLCAQRRGDAAGPLFSDALKVEGEERVHNLFSIIRESITLATGFVGLPNTMPANFGLIAQLKQRNITEVPIKPRLGFHEVNYAEVGNTTHKLIYRGVGNPEVSQMIAQYLPDLSYFATSAIFGYTIGGCNSMPLKESEIIIASSIIALGASRQARSHCKAAIQLGNSPELLITIDTVAHEIAMWNGTPLPERLDVWQQVKELEAELAKQAP